MKALALISGGLDSLLAVAKVKAQGIEVIGINFRTPFGLVHKDKTAGLHNWAEELASNFGIELKTVDISDAFLEIIKKPRYGFGDNMNPCIDCKILMLSKVREMMVDLGASFVVTGEVLGQRPMSQNLAALKLIEKESNLEGLLVRPLSALVLEETLPEKMGWIDRNKLSDFRGRGRKPQIQEAERLGLKDYPTPAGGCLLTDPEFSFRLKDLLRYGNLDLNNIELLKIGRHFRLSESAKLVVGRNQKENERILRLAQDNDYIFMPVDVVGPTALGRGYLDEELVQLSCRIVCYYCDLNGRENIEITLKIVPQKQERLLNVSVSGDDSYHYNLLSINKLYFHK
ncbi:MAG: tRNA 4-thiouridine(8) synthase ThiI [Candidatus Omnitrophica bacterium]|nr:tRNA 4-thiouridine(8) synthase ThiI [Candidatus Omnitrophota bacterium]